jgi:protein-S-isoprenylcysteine O-methyltransferase Ste14
MIMGPLYVLLLVEKRWEREYTTEARKRELEAKKLEKRKDRTSIKIWAAVSIIIILVLPLVLIVDGLVFKIGILYSPYLSFFTPLDIYLQIAGFFVSFLGLIVLVISDKIVIEHVYTKALEERSMITTGIYAFIRHPLYLSLILVPIGLLLLTLNYLSLVLFAAATIFTNGDLKECGREGKFTFITTAMKCEEKALIRIYGSDYEEYMKRTGRIFPKLGRPKNVTS